MHGAGEAGVAGGVAHVLLLEGGRRDRRAGMMPTMEPRRPSDGPPDSVRAAASTLRSRRHAQMLFDAVAALLGDQGGRETANGGTIQRLFRRDLVDSSLIVPWPVLELNIGGRFGVVTDWIAVGDAPLEPTAPRVAPPPKLRGLGPGEIRLVDGADSIEIVYNDEGAMLETCRSHAHPLAGLAPALAAEGANPIELLARFMASLDPSRHGPGRVRMPAAMPHGAAGVWCGGLAALRRALFGALFGDSAARGANWAVADGLTGTALGFGATREQAFARWRAAVAVHSPWPDMRPAPELPSDVPPGTMVIRAPSPDVPMPDAVPENVPAVLVPLEGSPAEAPTFGAWTTLLGAHGATSFAACRRKGKGFTLIGQHILPLVDLDQLDGEMDRVDEAHEARFREVVARTPGGIERRPCRTIIYDVRDGGRLAFGGASEGDTWSADGLDGDVIARRVVRQQWVG